jgi:glycosyltransferase involved in cell wall biosynthesis
MIVGIDARAAAEVPAGRGRFVRELLASLATMDQPHRFVLYCRRPWDGVETGPRMRWAPIGLPDPAWHAAAAMQASSQCDVFLSTNSYLTAWMLRVPSAVLVYDLIAFIPNTQPQKSAARIERATIRPAIRRAQRLICISRATEADLVRLFPRAAGRSAVVPLAADRSFHEARTQDQLVSVARRHGVEPGRYVMTTGTLEPRKNLPRLIRAHAALQPDLRREHPLLVTGPHGWEEREIVRAVADSDNVMLVGYVPDDDLAALYAACSVFCYPSLYEGFGLPVLEAMAAGAAVVTSGVSSLPEVGGDAVAYVDPRNESAISAALGRLLVSPQERINLAERARRRAAEFSWDRTTRAVLRELGRAAGRQSEASEVA